MAKRPLRELGILVALVIAWSMTFALILGARTLAVTAGGMALQTVLTIQLVLFFHDCLHGAVFRTARAHVLAGRLVGGLFFWPFHFLRDSHLRHHRNAGLVEDDPELLHFTREQAEKSRAAHFLSWVARTPVAPFVFTPVMQGLHFRRWLKNAGARALRSTIVDAVYMAMIWLPIDLWLVSRGELLRGFFLAYLLPAVLAMAAVYLAAKPLHTHMLARPAPELPHWKRALVVTRTFDSNPIVRVLFCNLNYHVEDHLFPTVGRWELGARARQYRRRLRERARAEGLPLATHPSYSRWMARFHREGPVFNDIQDLEQLRLSNERYGLA